ncbi:hypothetical protein C095_01670 [Fusobacterium necrophorum subsp. funduliforme B35]|uniref:Uncharacterized protein n=1 Tax=Fusobacterium necrophorum subsp. funduliforme B35 TaxID=1226633 RepID=A0A0B4ESW1_9FUSO|nr:hypothetical protein C095_01670 [Fusobacterium necrophorum subsp. funduliforme B35]
MKKIGKTMQSYFRLKREKLFFSRGRGKRTSYFK